MQAGLDGFSVIGGSIAVASGVLAGLALILNQDVSEAADRGVAIGGIWGVVPALTVFFLELSHSL
ncbi:MAG TPA: hypothetical protein VFX35_11370 [Solirubrobacterales bacterium]|nr:hypothetical protein [Solirubrobacterales bacterium]